MSEANPYDEDGYCDWCGNGQWKHHSPDCEWADARDSPADAATERHSDGNDHGNPKQTRRSGGHYPFTMTEHCELVAHLSPPAVSSDLTRADLR